MPLLAVHSLTAGYGANHILHDLEFTLDAGQFLGLVAPNGTGKSTLLKCLAGMLAPVAGEIWLAGRNIAQYTRREIARNVAMVGEDPEPWGFTTEQIVAMGRFVHIPRFGQAGPADRAAVRSALEEVGIGAKRDAFVSELSQGEKQKIVIARALAQEPRLLLLDEPTAHLDVCNQYQVLALIRRLAGRRGMAVVAVLHDINLALRFSDRIMLLKNGRIAADGEPRSIVSGSILHEVYGMKFIVHSGEDSCYVQPNFH